MNNPEIKTVFKNTFISVCILFICVIICSLMQRVFFENRLIPAIFVLAVFITSVLTDGFVFGVITALLSVLIVNFAFTAPILRLNFTVPENIISAIILLVVAITTSYLTHKIKKQEAIKAESEKERMRANLLRAVSHDLRTPLTTIYGSSTMLIDNYDSITDEQFIKILSGIREDSEWLSRMVENLLSVTRLDKDNVRITKVDTVLDELIDSILIKFAKRYSDIEVKVNIPDEFITIPMDPLLIEQVAVNMLDNAAQHAIGMKNLSLSVSVSDEKAVFEIEDDGCGISPEKIKEIFAGNYSTSFSPSDVKNNAGIGLSVCASIIKAHGGEIRAENIKDRGCRFSFVLSLEAENEQ